MEPKSLLLEAQQVTVMYSQVGVGNYFTLPRNTHGSWFCFAPSSSFLASCTKSISLQAAFLACWTLFFRVVFSFAFFLATSPKEPAAPDWATLCLPRPGGPGLTNLPVLSLQMLTASILCHYIYRPGLHHHTEKEGGNDYSDNSDSLSEWLFGRQKKQKWFFCLPNNPDNCFNSQPHFVPGALASSFCGSS